MVGIPWFRTMALQANALPSLFKSIDVKNAPKL
jgi:hypothetical protein